jgi:hypothetical protein
VREIKDNWRFIITAILMTLVIAAAWWVLKCPDEVYVTIGKFESKDAGLRAAIPILAAEIRKCPDAELYRVVWLGPGSSNYPEAVDRRALLYIQRSKALGYEPDVFSMFPEKPYIVDGTAIDAVAEILGGLEEFSKYDQSRKREE